MQCIVTNFKVCNYYLVICLQEDVYFTLWNLVISVNLTVVHSGKKLSRKLYICFNTSTHGLFFFRKFTASFLILAAACVPFPYSFIWSATAWKKQFPSCGVSPLTVNFWQLIWRIVMGLRVKSSSFFSSSCVSSSSVSSRTMSSALPSSSSWSCLPKCLCNHNSSKFVSKLIWIGWNM